MSDFDYEINIFNWFMYLMKDPTGFNNTFDRKIVEMDIGSESMAFQSI